MLKKISRKIIIIILLAIFTPYLIHLFYYIGENYFAILKTRFSPEEILSYSGSALAFIGTAILGLVTITQTQKANEETEKANRRMIDLTEKQLFESKNMEKAFFVIESCSYNIYGRDQFKKGYGNYSLNITKPISDEISMSITMKNIGNSAAVGFSNNLSVYKYSNRDGGRTLIANDDLEVIEKGSTITLSFKLSDFLKLIQQDNYTEMSMGFDISYENIYGIKYSQCIHFEFWDAPNNCNLFVIQHSPQITKTSPKEYFDIVYKTPDIE